MNTELKGASVLVQWDSPDLIKGTSWTINLPAGPRPPTILKGQDFTVIIVENKAAKGATLKGSKAPVALALADLIGLLALRDEDK